MGKAIVELPDGRKAQIEFDSQEQLDATVSDLMGKAAPQKPAGDIASTIQEPIATMATGMLALPVSGLAGIGTAGANALGLTNANPADVIGRIQELMTYRPRTQGGEKALGIMSYPFEKLAQGADWAGQKVSDVTGSPAAGAAVNTAIQAAPMLLTRAKVRNGNSGAPVLDRGPVPRQAEPPTPVAEKAGRQAGLESVPAKPPTVEELAAQAKAAYKRADESGVSISGNSVTRLKAQIVKDLNQEGLDKTLHPSTTAALKRITDSKGNLSLNEIETLRKIAKDAEKSTAPADVRLAAKMVDQIDNFVETLSPKDLISGTPEQALALKEARSLYSRQKKTQEIQDLFARAELSAPNFSGSGMENALRTEFRNLAKNSRKMRRFTAEERAAIEKVAKGGKVENAMRMLGKFAPSGLVSTVGSSAAGFMAGGPVGAVALPVAGATGRAIATRMTMKNAAKAEEIMRAGPEQTSAAAKAKAEKKKNALADF